MDINVVNIMKIAWWQGAPPCCLSLAPSDLASLDGAEPADHHLGGQCVAGRKTAAVIQRWVRNFIGKP